MLFQKIQVKHFYNHNTVDFIDFNDNFIDERIAANIISDISFKNGQTICIISVTGWGLGKDPDKFYDNYQMYQGLTYFRDEVTVIIKFQSKDIDRIRELEWCYGEGYYNFFFFDHNKEINVKALLNKWDMFRYNEKLFYTSWDDIVDQRKWGKKIEGFMEMTGCKMFMTTDSDDACLRLCLYREYHDDIKDIIESLSYIKIV